jgi:hypothetical protein
MAVGYGRSAVAAHWNGTRWRAQALDFGDPEGRPNALTGVSCTLGGCAAVGWDNVGLCSGGDDNFYDLPVLGFWTEQLWSLRRHPNLACADSDGGAGHLLNGVSCTSQAACTAVGDGVYRWNGRRWSVQSVPVGADSLDAVSCTATDACTAVGSRVYTWNGHHWSEVLAAEAELTGVSCMSRASCVAVGSSTDDGDGSQMLIESTGMGTR